MERGSREDVVEQVRHATDIVELIGAYVNLRQAGRDHKACCPFHGEKTPSFHVSSERQLFHCFGCGVGGDAFSFVMKHEGLSFPEALEMLANRAGITLPERKEQGGPDRTKLVAAMRAAVRYYRGKLKGAAGSRAARYLAEREIPDELLDRYYVGYAPAGGSAFLDYAGKKFPVDLLVEAGLIGRGESGRLYDRFRERIVIPILAVGGAPIGFGARALRPDMEPKYLNSPETPIYKKSRVLFGLPQARGAIRAKQGALVVEGYFDVLGLAAYGINHTVAPCGTAWTSDHVRLLLRYTQRPIFLFDGDSAGEQAAWRALQGTLPIHPDVGIVVLPPGKDPDDMVRGGQLEALTALLAAPLSPVAFVLASLTRQGIDGHPRIARVAELIASVGNDIAREMMIDEAAERARLQSRILRQEVARLGRPRTPRRGRPAGASGEPTHPPEPIRLSPLEEAVLHLAHCEPAAAEKIRAAAVGVVAVREAIREVLAWVADRARAGTPPEPPELVRRVQAEVGEGIGVGFLMDDTLPEPGDEFRSRLLRHLREQALEGEMESLGYRIREQEGAGERGEGLAKLLQRKQLLARELARLREPGSSARA